MKKTISISRTLVLIVTLLLNYIYTFGQNTSIDELKISYQNCKENNKQKIDLATDIAYQIYIKSPEEATKNIEDALQWSKEINYNEGIVNSLWIKGIMHTYTDREKALQLFEEAHQIALKNSYEKGICNASLGISNIHNELGNIHHSDSILKSIIVIAENVEDKKLLSKIYYNLARNRDNNSQYHEAIDLFEKVVNISTIENEKQMLSRSYSSIANCYIRLGKLTNALDYNIKARLISEEIGDKRGETSTIINIAGILYEQNEYDEAIKILQDGYNIAKEINDKHKMIACLLNKGIIEDEQNIPEALVSYNEALELASTDKLDIQIAILENLSSYYIKQNKFNEAIKYLNKSQEIAERTQNQRLQEAVWMRYGEYYNKLNEQAKAITYLNKALSASESGNRQESIRQNNLLLSDSYAKLGDYKKAFEHFVNYKNINDSIFNVQNIRQLALIESSYEYEKQKRVHEIETENNELKIKGQQNIIIGITISSLLITILMYMVYRSAKLKKQVLLLKIENIKREADIREKEMAAAKLKLVQSAERATHCLKLLENIEDNVSSDSKSDMRSLINYYKHQSDESSWTEFETLFIKISPDFYQKLNELYPTLTPNERKLCVFLKLNMSNKDINKITFQSEEALKKARLRLRKKMNLDREINLTTFMQEI